MPMVSHFSGIQLLETGWTILHQAPLSMRFPKQEYCSGLPFPTHKMHSAPPSHPKRKRVLWKKRNCGPLLVSESLCKKLRDSHSILTSKKLGRLLKTETKKIQDSSWISKMEEDTEETAALRLGRPRSKGRNRYLPEWDSQVKTLGTNVRQEKVNCSWKTARGSVWITLSLKT